MSVDELVSEVVFELAKEVKRFIYLRECFSQMSALNNSTDKLVYMYVWLTQPQTFASVRRSLNLSKATLARSLRRLEQKGLIVREGPILYAAETSTLKNTRLNVDEAGHSPQRMRATPRVL
jgi:predicted transcriptional regulator